MSNKSTKIKLNDPVTRAVIRIIGSIIIILSGAILFLDKIFDFELSNTHGFADSQTFIWVFTQSISPLLIILGALLRTYKIAYLIPVYFYAIQLYWVFDSSLKIDDKLLHIYALGVTIFIGLATVLINKFFKNSFIARNNKISLLEEMLDLSFNINKAKK